MKKHLTRFSAALSLLLLVEPALSQEEATPSLVVIDLRPSEEKEGNGLSALSGKCNEDVYRIADVATDPLKVDVLKEDLAPLLGPSGKTLTVLNWSIYYNKQVQGGEGSMIKGVGVGGYTIPTGKKKEKHPGSKCSRKESAGGWYLGGEVTGIYFPIISEFQGTFGGKPLTARVVHSPTRKLEGKFQGESADTEALLDAIHKTSEAVAAAIDQ